MVPRSVNLFALLMRLSSACRSRMESACSEPIAPSQRRTSWLPFFAAQRLNGLDDAFDERRKREIFELPLHTPSLNLGQVENVVDQRKQMPARAEHAVERLGILLQCLSILAQHFADAD